MIYLDNNATTNIHPDVLAKMLESQKNGPLNPSSIHAYGRKARSLIENARKSIANLLGFDYSSKEYQLVFTSSGTESNQFVLSNFQDGEIFISASEHMSIFAHHKLSNNITVINVDNNGLLDLSDLESKLQASSSDKRLVSVMLANNESGIIQPIKEISKIVHKHNALMHSDCVQAIGKIDCNIKKLDLDFASISAHKFGGPLGAAALVFKANISVKPIFVGGGQEKSLRSGTENVPAIVGFGTAADIVRKNLQQRAEHLKNLQIKLETDLLKSNPNIKIVGTNVTRLPNTSLIITPGKKAETQLIALDLRNIAVSSGSACSSGKTSPSHVLLSMGYSENEINSAIRVSTGIETTQKDIDDFIKIYNEVNA
ncbi:cysteine desulfurase [Rickettsiaceae bacterium]|nr:cysteine desulfurase [Rickettsiaceae bacterium]